MKKIYMSQPNSQYGNSIYFPYAAGCLVAYALENERLAREYEFGGFIYKRIPVEEALKQIKDPYLVGFSCYVWNYEYNKALAKALKEKYPECITVFGGHQINESSEVVGSYYADFVIVGEGERTFEKLLLSFLNKDTPESIPNLIYKTESGEIKINARSGECPVRVSPYLGGYFDSLVENESLVFSSILETNRGCPNKCAFCDWGNIKTSLYKFDINLVKAEIDWMSENRIEYCYCSDANFGILDRDLEIVDYVIEKYRKTGWPKKFQATFSKNNPQRVFELNRKINAAGMSKGATLSFQSMSQEVLDKIYRKNMPIEKFRELMNLYLKNSIPTYSELILGLPGETYESFKDGIEQLLENGQHMSINFFNCEILTNSIMNSREYLEEHGIKYSKIRQHQYHVVPKEDDIEEYSNIIVSTSSMPDNDWIKTNIFESYIYAFHNLGILQCIAIYLFFEKGIRYKDFYCDIIRQSEENPDSLFGKIYLRLKDNFTQVLNGKGGLTCTVKEYGNLTWPLDEGAFLEAITDYDLLYEEIRKMTEKYFDDELLFDELLKYQKHIVKNPYTGSVRLKLHLDFYAYFSKIYNNEYVPLHRALNTIFIDQSDVSDNLQEYSVKTIWFGRKGGQNIVSRVSYKHADSDK